VGLPDVWPLITPAVGLISGVGKKFRAKLDYGEHALGVHHLKSGNADGVGTGSMRLISVPQVTRAAKIMETALAGQWEETRHRENLARGETPEAGPACAGEHKPRSGGPGSEFEPGTHSVQMETSDMKDAFRFTHPALAQLGLNSMLFDGRFYLSICTGFGADFVPDIYQAMMEVTNRALVNRMNDKERGIKVPPHEARWIASRKGKGLRAPCWLAFSYLDDRNLVVMGDADRQARMRKARIEEEEHRGLVENLGKRDGWTRVLTWLGLSIDLDAGTISLTEKRIAEIREELVPGIMNSARATEADLHKLEGVLSFASQVVQSVYDPTKVVRGARIDAEATGSAIVHLPPH